MKYILTPLIFSVILISGCTETGGVPVYTLKSFVSPSGTLHRTPNQEIFQPVPLITNGENTHLSLQFELSETPIRGKAIKLTLGEGLGYISGPFARSGSDYFIFIEQDKIPPEDALQSFVIEVTEKGKHPITLTVLDENMEFVEARLINICVSDTSEKAIEMCTDPGCQTETCIKERLMTTATQI